MIIRVQFRIELHPYYVLSSIFNFLQKKWDCQKEATNTAWRRLALP